MLLQIAKQEDRHLARFTEMQAWHAQGQTEAPGSDHAWGRSLYLEAVAARPKCDGGADASELTNAMQEVAGVIHHALTNEKQAILFYLGMKDGVTTPQGAAAMNEIIEEEMKHIEWLYAHWKSVEAR